MEEKLEGNKRQNVKSYLWAVKLPVIFILFFIFQIVYRE